VPVDVDLVTLNMTSTLKAAELEESKADRGAAPVPEWAPSSQTQTPMQVPRPVLFSSKTPIAVLPSLHTEKVECGDLR